MILWTRTFRSARAQPTPLTARRWLSIERLERRLQDPVQSYISKSRDPYLNLSIEHHLLQNSDAESAILFLYVNRPSIIIGRNQNPWLEVNLALLDSARKRLATEQPGLGAVDLVRRRSGGGTVFHDEGNVNWTVICPSATFTRDKHAEMVVRALRSRAIDWARVNERHDIVLDQGPRIRDPDMDNTHVTPYTAKDSSGPRPLKISGSAYKLTRGRALHHGTCLLSSLNLDKIPHYLHSPAKPYIAARGVESVSSPVANVNLSNKTFIDAVKHQFKRMYSEDRSLQPGEVGEELLGNELIRKGYDELKSLDWTYLQTPRFTLSSAGAGAVDSSFELSVHHGSVTAASLNADDEVGKHLVGLKLHEVSSWESVMTDSASDLDAERRDRLVEWLHIMLPPMPAR